MQPCNRIYCSNVYWRLNIWFNKTCRDDPVPTQTWLRPVTTYVCKPEAAITV